MTIQLFPAELKDESVGLIENFKSISNHRLKEYSPLGIGLIQFADGLRIRYYGATHLHHTKSASSRISSVTVETIFHTLGCA